MHVCSCTSHLLQRRRQGSERRPICTLSDSNSETCIFVSQCSSRLQPPLCPAVKATIVGVALTSLSPANHNTQPSSIRTIYTQPTQSSHPSPPTPYPSPPKDDPPTHRKIRQQRHARSSPPRRPRTAPRPHCPHAEPGPRQKHILGRRLRAASRRVYQAGPGAREDRPRDMQFVLWQREQRGHAGVCRRSDLR